jgi:hypothetical protein
MAMTHADRFRWEQDVLANPQLTAAQKIVLTRLALHLNIKTGRCDPSVKTLATGAGMAERTVQATLSRAETLGIIERAIGGGRTRTTSSLHPFQKRRTTKHPFQRCTALHPFQKRCTTKHRLKWKRCTPASKRVQRTAKNPAPPCTRTLRTRGTLMSASKRSSTAGIQFTHGEAHVAQLLNRTSKPAPAVQRRKPCCMVQSDMPLSEPARTHNLPKCQPHGSMAIVGSTSRRSSWPIFPQHLPGTRKGLSMAERIAATAKRARGQ